MELKNRVCSFEQAKKLKGLGVPQDACMKFCETKEGQHYINMPPFGCAGTDVEYSAYDVAEIGEMLPMYCDSGRTHTGWECIYKTRPSGLIHMEGCHKTEAEARAAMLIYLLENNLYTLDQQ